MASTIKSFDSEVKLARECTHWNKWLSDAQKEKNQDTDYIGSVTKKIKILNCKNNETFKNRHTKFLEFIFRYEQCKHFGSEEPYDEKRANYLKKKIKQYKCTSLDNERQLLSSTNQGYIIFLKEIDSLEELGYFPEFK
jgi:hypothetical protein